MLDKINIYLYAIKYYLIDMLCWEDAVYIATTIVTGWRNPDE